MERIRVLLVEDHAIVREGIRSLLKDQQDIEVVGEAVDGAQALARVRELKPHIVLMDISMPRTSGFEATRAIKAEFPDVQVLALTVHEGAEYLFRVLSEGASGYLVKGASFDELVQAIRAVHEGGVYLHPSVAGKLVQGYVGGARGAEEQASFGGLTRREREVLKLIGDGLTNQEIARMMFLSPNTVQTHRSRIMEKLGLHSRTQLIRYAVSKGLIEAGE